MGRFIYDSDKVIETQEELIEAGNYLKTTTNELSRGVKYIENARGSQYVKISEFNLEEIVQFPTKVAQSIIDLIDQIRTKAQEIEEYNNTPINKKFIASFVSATTEIFKGIASVAESVIKGAATGIGKAVHNDNVKEKISKFVDKDYVGTYFKYADEAVSSIESKSLFSSDSTIAKIYRAEGYVSGVGLLGYGLGGGMGADVAIAGLGGLGRGTQNALQQGKSFDDAADIGLLTGVKDAAITYAAGAILKGIGNSLNKASTVANTADDVVSSVGSTADDVLRLPGEVEIPTGTMVDSSGNVIGVTSKRVNFSAVDNIDDIASQNLGIINKADDVLSVSGPIEGEIPRLPGEVEIPTGTMVDSSGNVIGVTSKRVNFGATDNIDDIINQNLGISNSNVAAAGANSVPNSNIVLDTITGLKMADTAHVFDKKKENTSSSQIMDNLKKENNSIKNSNSEKTDMKNETVPETIDNTQQTEQATNNNQNASLNNNVSNNNSSNVSTNATVSTNTNERIQSAQNTGQTTNTKTSVTESKPQTTTPQTNTPDNTPSKENIPDSQLDKNDNSNPTTNEQTPTVDTKPSDETQQTPSTTPDKTPSEKIPSSENTNTNNNTNTNKNSNTNNSSGTNKQPQSNTAYHPTNKNTENVQNVNQNNTSSNDASENVVAEDIPSDTEKVEVPKKVTIPTEENLKKSSGSKAIPIGIGIAATAGAAVAGARYLKNKKDNEEETEDSYTDDSFSDEEYNNDLIDPEDNVVEEDKKESETQGDNLTFIDPEESEGEEEEEEQKEKYKAGTVNKLSIGEIDDTADYDIFNDSEEEEYLE